MCLRWQKLPLPAEAHNGKHLSHGTGAYRYVPPMAKAAVACGADGLMIEVHNNPACALSDGPQSLNFEKFARLSKELDPFWKLAGRN